MRKKRLSRITFCLIGTILISTTIPAAADTYYKIRKGDTLWKIAAKHNTTVNKIAKANGLNENATLALGKTIRIPTGSASVSSNQKKNSSNQIAAFVHTNVKSACLRSGPGTQFKKISVLAKGSTGKVLASTNEWTKVAFSDGTCGYIYNSLLAKGEGSITKVNVNQTRTISNNASKSSVDNSLIQTALSCRGAKYRRGGTSRGGFDCSGFTRYVFAKYGVKLPHSSAAQAKLGKPIAKSELQAGDLVFFQTYSRGISHVGIYIGDRRFVHAATYGRGVTVDSLDSSYYAPRYRGARRVK